MTERSREVKHDIRAAFHSSKPEADAAFYSNRNRNKDSKDGPKQKCDHCGKFGHEKSKCFEIVGYPSWWDMSRMSRKRTTNSGGAQLAWAENGGQSRNTAQEGHNVALHGTCNNTSNNQQEYMSGNKLIFGKNSWVLDSGASHHMTPLYHLLNNVCDLEEPLHITVPTGAAVIVQKKGNVTLNSNITLLDVLFIPQFSCNI